MMVSCTICGKKIYRKPCLKKRSKRFFCSRECLRLGNIGRKQSKAEKEGRANALRGRRTGYNFKCLNCKKEQYRQPSHYQRSKNHFCNLVCKGIYYRGIHQSKKSEFPKGNRPINPIKKGEHRGKLTEFKKGNIPWIKGTANPKAIEIKRFRARQRELLLKRIPGSHSLKEWEDLKIKFRNRCAICGLAEPFKNQKYPRLTEDHIVPITKGGSNYIRNIQPACMKCNIRKRDHLPKIIEKVSLSVAQ